MVVGSCTLMGGVTVGRVTCADCFSVRNSPHEPTKVAGSDRCRSSAVLRDVALRLGEGDPEGRRDVQAVVRGSAGCPRVGVLRERAIVGVAGARVARPDAGRHAAELVRQWALGSAVRFTRDGFPAAALAVAGAARRAGPHGHHPRRRSAIPWRRRRRLLGSR